MIFSYSGEYFVVFSINVSVIMNFFIVIGERIIFVLVVLY